MFNNRWLPWVIAALALVGLFDATYLTTEHFLGATPTCFITTGCDTVLTSQYANVGPMPLSLLGVGYYLTILGLGLSLAMKPTRQRAQILAILTSIGLLVSAGLVYLQLGVIHAICAYCMLSATTSLLLWLTGLGYVLSAKKNINR